MRESAEPSVDLRTYFGKCLEAKYRIPLKHLGLRNFYGANTGDLAQIGDPTTITSSDFISTFGGSRSGPSTIFIDDTWKNIPDGSYFAKLKRSRTNETSTQHAKILSSFSGLEELYLINAQPESVVPNGSSRSTTEGAISPAPIKTPASSNSSPGKVADQMNATLCKEYLNALTSCHGVTMKKLLLSDQWSLDGEQISSIVSACPNLEQLGLALSSEEGNALRILAPFLTKLKAIRILQNPWLCQALREDPDMSKSMDADPDEAQYWKMPPSTRVLWVGIGDAVFKLGDSLQMPEDDGTMVWKRVVHRVSLEDVKHVDIWKLDVLDI